MSLRDFAELHAPNAMRRWREAHAACQLRELNGDSGEADPTNPADPGNVTAQAEAEIETALAEILKERRYSIEGRRNGIVERLQAYTRNRLRLALGTGGVIEIDHEGRTTNAWNDCDVIDDIANDDAGPASDAKSASVPSAGATVSDTDIAVCVEELRRELKAQRLPHGRDELIRLVADRLQVQGKRVRSLWDNRGLAEKRGASKSQ
jgi:hypothetical protein